MTTIGKTLAVRAYDNHVSKNGVDGTYGPICDKLIATITSLQETKNNLFELAEGLANKPPPPVDLTIKYGKMKEKRNLLKSENQKLKDAETRYIKDSQSWNLERQKLDQDLQFSKNRSEDLERQLNDFTVSYNDALDRIENQNIEIDSLKIRALSDQSDSVKNGLYKPTNKSTSTTGGTYQKGLSTSQLIGFIIKNVKGDNDSVRDLYKGWTSDALKDELAQANYFESS